METTQDNRKNLATEPEADKPVAWMRTTPNGDQIVAFHKTDGFEPLYTRPEPEAEPVFIRPDHLALARKSPFLCQVGPVQVADFVPLYTKPEPAIRKPMTDGDLLREWQRHFYNDAWDAFEAGIRFAEKHHGISEE